ncbi:zf-HC2 domain-containing protein [Clostridium bornimense]|uniref:zf-HC2 domain-containing protein n=1 Tax=Clostridium bornimense TaxID=1216932 RepID=UPI001C1072A7|nr:zf-HC2 domain-containing protein [Clostridium bornimense]MBU5317298.1 zf-HC2 domain-containing protein [Clostridium bornimense]
MKEEISCEIIKDLLPNYIDNVLSNEGKEIVEEHLNNCDSCRKEYEILRSSIEIDTVDATKINYLKKINLKLLITIISLLVVTVISSMLLTFYTESNFDEGIMTLLFSMFAFILIIVKFALPLVGLVFSSIYLKNKRKKILIIPVILFSIWLFESIYSYIYNLIHY